MRRTTVAAAIIGIAIVTTGCTSSSTSTTAAGTTPASSPTATATGPSASAPAAPAPQDAKGAFTALTTAVPSLTLVKAYTATDDPNHLLGRPGQYTSKVAFKDSRIAAADVELEDEDSVARGGSVEVFTTAADAQARAAYLEKVTKTMPALVEYDYVAGTAVLRVSQKLTPDQAKAMQEAFKG